MDQRTCRNCGTGFTPTHSRNVYCQPECRQDEHRKVEKTCDCCGATCMKAPTSRYSATYCSILCRDYTRWGGQSCAVPSDHWARWWGRTSEWIAPVIRNTGECEWCGRDNTRGLTARFCADRCKAQAKSRRRRAREYGAPGEFRFSEVMRQYQRQGCVCAYCEKPCDGLPDPEHVTPLSRGGRNDMANIVAACKSCNSDKRDLTLSEWAADRVRRGKSPVRTHLVGQAFLHLAS